MDDRRFDGIARLVATGIGRRRVVAGLAGMLLAGMFFPNPALASCKNPRQRCDQNQDCCAHAKCKGGRCACKNGFDDCGNDCVKTDTDENNCGRCNRRCGAGETCRNGSCAGPCGGRTCTATEECLAGVCTTPPGGCAVGANLCTDGPVASSFCGGPSALCFCTRTTEGATVCGDEVTPGAACGQCQTSADCASFGPGAFCRATGAGSPNCCPIGPPNRCQLPCSG